MIRIGFAITVALFVNLIAGAALVAAQTHDEHVETLRIEHVLPAHDTL